MNKAFTLIELMVTVCIIVVLIMLFSVSLNRAHRNRYAIVVPISKQQ